MNIEKLKPVGNKVLIKLEHAPTHTNGGLIIPYAENRRGGLARVVSVGSDVRKEIYPGAIINFDIYEGMRIDAEHIMIKDEFITCTIDIKEGA